jgi:DNA repair protein SbcD/Mre11
VHLGVETYGKYNPETGLNTRFEDFAESLEMCITQALEQQVDIAIFAGDAYKVRDPNQTHQRAFAGALKRLTDANIPVVMLVGNHDIPNTRGRAHALEIYGLLGGAGYANVQILHSASVITVPTAKGEVLVAGMPYLTRSRVLAQEETKGKTVEEVSHLMREKYAVYIKDMADQCAARPDHIAILTGHFTVADARVGTQNFLLNPNEPQVPVSEIAHPAFAYVAMGHIHKPQEMNNKNQPPVVYCGSIDRIDFGERGDDKGFVLVDIEKRAENTTHAAWRHVALPTRPFLDISIDTTVLKDNADPTEHILTQLEKQLKPNAIARVRYTVTREKQPLIREAEIKKFIHENAYVVVAVNQETPQEEALVRSQAIAQAVTPEHALALYIDTQPRLQPRREDLVAAARPLFDLLLKEENDSIE